MSQLVREVMRYAERLGPQEWVLVFAAMILVGLFFLRGFGSRSRY